MLSASWFCPEKLSYLKLSACLNANYDSVILPQNCPGAEILALFQLSELKVILYFEPMSQIGCSHTQIKVFFPTVKHESSEIPAFFVVTLLP